MSRRERILGLRERSPLILPSMLLCDFGDLRTEVRLLEAAGFQALHLDVMDGVLVPNFSYGLPVVAAFRQATRLPLDVHLMMVNPERYFDRFFEAGADSLTFHIEAVDDALHAVRTIQDLGMAAGVAVDRDTPVSAIERVAGLADIVLVMTIKAGFGGQEFLPELLAKLPQVRELAGERPVLEVDGGVNAGSIRACLNAGAEWLVAGSAVFRGEHYETAHGELKELAGVS